VKKGQNWGPIDKNGKKIRESKKTHPSIAWDTALPDSAGNLRATTMVKGPFD
jgi:hypothetical protein